MLELPLEVVELVCEYASVDDLLNLRGVHSWLKEIATSAIPVECQVLECPGSGDSGESLGSDKMIVAPALRIEGRELVWVGHNQRCWVPQIKEVVINFSHVSLCREAWNCLQSLKLHQRVWVKFVQPIRINQEYQQLMNKIGRSDLDCKLMLSLTAWYENDQLTLDTKVTCIRLLIDRQMVHGFVAPKLYVSHQCSLDLVLDFDPRDEVGRPTNKRDKSEYLPHIQSLYRCLNWQRVELRNVDHYCLASVFSKLEFLACRELTIKDYTDLSVVSTPIECHATEVTIERSSFLQIQSFDFPHATMLKLIDSPDQNTGEHISPNSGVWQNVLPRLPQLRHLKIKNLVLWDDSDLSTLLKGLVGSLNLETLHITISFPSGLTHEDFDITDGFISELVSNCLSLQSVSFADSEEKSFYSLLYDDIQTLRFPSSSPET
ncbi:hypothetical protein TRICI_002547 [Trichomonascus ciferrii]|uniref:F-box domain-containing protein n=1 Tax=Trichomonascus ciferrii TaxID=44093 RepID=A0A642V5M7_9ASCO|nr:hypothetical protein TRICI_002547 [Trichomonascus ciferrii]